LARGIQPHLTKGLDIEAGSVVRLLKLLANYLHEPTYAHFAEVIRHPDVELWIDRETKLTQWLATVDAFQNEILPLEVRLDQQRQFTTKINQTYPIKKIVDSLRRLLEPLLLKLPKKKSSKGSHPLRNLADWATAWHSVLENLYGDAHVESPNDVERGEPRTLAFDSATVQAAQVLATTLQTIAEHPLATWELGSARDALKLLLGFIENPFLPSADTNTGDNVFQVDVAGWLELPWGSSIAMVIAGMNNHVLPAAEGGHAFLPNSLCTQLGLHDNRRRLARDVYYLALINASCPNLLLVCGRRDMQKAPLLVSRLLLQCDDSTLIKRSTAFFDFNSLQEQQNSTGEANQDAEGNLPVERQKFAIPMPQQIPVLNKMSVTRFRDYLKCPYRFYLAAVLKLRSAADAQREFSAGQFGDLAHNVLEAFGQSPVKDSEDEEQIRDFLTGKLNEFVKQLAVKSRMPAVMLQAENLEIRLEHFAALQAKHRQSGWRIVSVEERFDHPFMVDQQPFHVIGMVDRVDQHEDGRIAIWDYKTSEKKTRAEQAHRDSDHQWIDLQLPLYRHMIQARFPHVEADDIGLGYILLPNSTKDIAFDQATWNSSELAQADETAWSIIRSIRDRIFWPPAPTPDYAEEWAGICQDHVFEIWQPTWASAKSS
jgi:RecB family exonuclease